MWKNEFGHNLWILLYSQDKFRLNVLKWLNIFSGNRKSNHVWSIVHLRIPLLINQNLFEVNNFSGYGITNFIVLASIRINFNCYNAMHWSLFNRIFYTNADNGVMSPDLLVHSRGLINCILFSQKTLIEAICFVFLTFNSRKIYSNCMWHRNLSDGVRNLNRKKTRHRLKRQ